MKISKKMAIMNPVMVALGLLLSICVVDASASGTNPKSAAGNGRAYHDWLASRSVEAGDDGPRGQPEIAREAPGRGSWICSAAGFGQKSRCHVRK